MNKVKGQGRTRIGRFAAITIPATVATAGLGFAMLQGMVGASLSSANGFGLESDSLASDGLALRNGSATVAGQDNGDATVYAQTQNTTAKSIGLRSASVSLGPLGDWGIQISSTDDDIALKDVSLNAKSLNADGGASLKNVNIGVAQSETGAATSAGGAGFSGFDNGNGASANGFSLNASDPDGKQGNTLSDLKAAAYAITLSSLDLDNLKISLKKNSYNPVESGVTAADFQ